MNDRIIDLARELIRTYGFSLLDDSERLGQLLEDKCGDDRHEVFLLCFALREVSKNGAFPTADELSSDRKRIITGFCRDLGFSEYVAEWAFSAIELILSDAEEMERSSSARDQHVEARRGSIRSSYHGMAARPRTAPIRKKALRNGLLLLGIALLFLGLYVKMSGSRLPVDGEHRILFLAHLSGPEASSGHVRLKSAQLAADIINEQGGIKGSYMHIAVKDVPSSAERAEQTLRSMLRDGSYTAMISACNDEVSSVLARVADVYETPLVASGSSRISITMEDDRPLLYAFRMNYDNTYKGKIIAYFSAAGLKRKKIALLSLAYDKDAEEVRASFIDSFSSTGGEVVCNTTYTRSGGLDAASASEVLASDADCVVIVDPTSDVGRVIAVLRDAGYTNTIVGSCFDDTVAAAAGGALNDVWWIVPSSPDDSQLMSFQSSYMDKYNESVSRGDFVSAILAYDSVRWTADALYRAPGSQGEALRHAFLSTKNLALTHATLSLDPRTHSPWAKSASLLYSTDGSTKFQRRFRPQ